MFVVVVVVVVIVVIVVGVVSWWCVCGFRLFDDSHDEVSDISDKHRARLIK